MDDDAGAVQELIAPKGVRRREFGRFIKLAENLPEIIDRVKHNQR